MSYQDTAPGQNTSSPVVDPYHISSGGGMTSMLVQPQNIAALPSPSHEFVSQPIHQATLPVQQTQQQQTG